MYIVTLKICIKETWINFRLKKIDSNNKLSFRRNKAKRNDK